ncbi:MAG TPA: transcriptional regulator [Planctomycetes bacterium]|nr:transcriptional regulator [Planctomycetota bacterium]
MVARLRATRDEDIVHDDDESTGEPTFRLREAVRRRILSGAYQDGDVAALRVAFQGLSQSRFAQALGISIDTLQNWEQNRRQPDGPAKALLRLLARHPRLLTHDLLPMAV